MWQYLHGSFTFGAKIRASHWMTRAARLQGWTIWLVNTRRLAVTRALWWNLRVKMPDVPPQYTMFSFANKADHNHHNHDSSLRGLNDFVIYAAKTKHKWRCDTYLDSCRVYGWRRGRLCRSPKPVAQTRKKIRQQQNHAGCWWHSCLGKQKGREMNPFPDVSIDVEIKN